MADPACASVAAARVAELLGQELRDVAALPADTAAFKSSELPLARIKKIMKLDDDIKGLMIAAEAPLLFSKAAELLIKELTLRAWIHTERNRRRTLQRADISASVYDQDTDQFDFLIDIVPREEAAPATPASAAAAAASAPSRPPPSSSASVSADLDAGPPIGIPGSGASPMPTMATATTVGQSQQQPVQYVIQLGGGGIGGGGGGGQPMQIAFVSSQSQQHLMQHHQPLQFATASGGDASADGGGGGQLALDVKPDISHVVMATGGGGNPVPISFAGL